MMIQNRLDQARGVLQEHNLDALLITGAENRFYLSGFSGTSGVLLVSSAGAWLLTDFRYLGQAAREAPLYEVIRYRDDYRSTIGEVVKQNGWKRLGFEADNLSCLELERLSTHLSTAPVPISGGIEHLRRIKDSGETAIMKQGAAVLDLACDWLKDNIKAGQAERDLAVELEIFLLRQGSEKPSFTFIVASGERGSMPHGVASSKVMHEGELVTVDFGAVFNHYATDMTRTFALGHVDRKQLEIYNIVREAQNKSAEAVKPGVQCGEVDRIARDIITEAGYGHCFGHGLGHSIGLVTHEQPALVPGSDTVLEPGMIVTVEPGIYIDGWGGVRIEDMVQVTETGAERLTKSSQELIII